ncbi:MAG: aminotransferase class I/II-fold pyridoxal phosphate-dependent enzyme [Peptoniphilaceae bacterium]|nr:aminotransferase class I/II-fold pyridoxal phosphate-dependent enzyme [Peptoniphilaceae bacterium]MDY6019743.1 aminotransferase class I/II-fold pyridoxal phosphate-dependent enzyme [Anaerococcus sp.]
MTSDMLAQNARWPKFDDKIFAAAKRASDAINLYGKEKVIDSTLGALYDDDGNIVAFDSVYKCLENMDRSLIASYAPIEGTIEFQKNVIDVCFGKYKPQAYIRAVATPGGTGAVRHGIWSFTGEDDPVICHDWYWPSYELICDEFKRNFVTYELFDEKYKFNIKAFEKTFRKELRKKDRLLAIFNTPANNPTGYSLSDDEWDRVLEIVLDEAKNKNKKITLLLDVAYMEYAGSGEQKKFFTKFQNLPDNIFILIAFSMSKAYTAYGMRSGAAIGLSSNEDIVDDFYYSLSHANRANWSNGNHSAMEILTKLNEDKDMEKSYLEDLNKYRAMLEGRARAFIESSKEVGLEILPYFGGFFISIPAENSEKISSLLEEKNIFIIANKNGLRFAVCAVSKDKCRKTPRIIKEVMDSIKK